MKEAKLYESVRKFVEKKFKCHAARELGKEGIGFIDIFGISNKNSKEIEVIGVEVKTSKRFIAAYFGQAKGYSLFCHKIYFASPDDFNKEDIEIAKFLKMGLIKIGKSECKEILKAPANKPMPKLLKTILERKKIIRCDSCGTIAKRNFTETQYNINKLYNYTKELVKKGKDLSIKNKKFYCNKCAKKIGLK
jgi:hypothetical protein